ncbi:uncharacterized protein KD926_010463 [Aspergillus affinis]|uniref:uncharacterized protein n=1 Tax=Aspergillus affinis TaxID=1070780 RepID=UPI0022FE8614|nr:uncharacterized protein KD926_010463 [Aspergillus affinis]KAI9038728.1 hypothetical protein KD926_010463 [Aspergillus affinis]
MPVLVEFEPAELLSGEDNRLKRQAHSDDSTPYNSQGAHQSDLDPRRHITFMAWNEKGECFGPFHENFSYQQEQQFIAMIADRPALSSSASSSSRSSSTSSGTGSFIARGVGSNPPANEDDGESFQLVTRKRRKSSNSAGKGQLIGNSRF